MNAELMTKIAELHTLLLSAEPNFQNFQANVAADGTQGYYLYRKDGSSESYSKRDPVQQPTE